MRLAIIIAIIAVGVLVAQYPDAKMNRSSNEFVESYNDWLSTVQKMSPYSPDYGERIAEEWHKRELGRKFREVESEVTE